ncbi:serine acetyltransferase [Tenacibaculum crassostreae]|uniref:serine acetyltransferase n=1 Tax=Tenacibaculum crassostreae TaxID=502683 RepID=UPI003895689F
MIYDDLYRYTGKKTFVLLLRYVLFTPGFRYVFFLRKCQQSKNSIVKIFWLICLRLCMHRTGIQIPYQTRIDNGFRIAHFGNIVINPSASIGKNFNIANGVTIGNASGKKSGVPVIGNNVYVSANAVIIGRVKIGDNVLVAPNAFVNIDIPDGAIALGNPCQIIPKHKASEKYIVYKI